MTTKRDIRCGYALLGGSLGLFATTGIAAAQAIARRGVDDIPDWLAAADLGLDRGPGIGNGVLVDGDTELLGGGIEDRHRLCLLIGAALRDEGDLFGGISSRGETKCAQQCAAQS